MTSKETELWQHPCSGTQSVSMCWLLLGSVCSVLQLPHHVLHHQCTSAL